MIELVTHPTPPEVMMARRDHAHITGRPLVERPWWYRDTDLGYLYHDLYACIGWPSKVSDKDVGMPGYAGIIAVVREDDSLNQFNPRDAEFLVLAETENFNVPTLLQDCLRMRERYGFGVQKDLLKVWYGDPDRFITPLALFNERLSQEQGKGKDILISPPEDFYTPNVFDLYARALHSVVIDGQERLFPGKTTILKERTEEFRRDDPAVMAAGGLIHTMLNQTLWMEDTSQSIFVVEDSK